MIIVMYLCPFNLPGKKYKGKEQAAMGNTAIACHRGHLLALNEAGYPIEVKLSSEGSMSTGEVVRYDGRLDHPFTAHPKIDPATNEMCFFGYECVFHQPWACMSHEALLLYLRVQGFTADVWQAAKCTTDVPSHTICG